MGIAFAGHCVAAVLAAVWRYGFVATSPGGGVGPLAMHLGVPGEAIVETWMYRVDNMMLVSLIHMLENTIEDLREQVAAVLLLVGTLQSTTNATETASMGRRAVAPGNQHQLLYTTLGLANKFSPVGAAGEMLEALVALRACVKDLERGTRERRYRPRGLEMVLRRIRLLIGFR